MSVTHIFSLLFKLCIELCMELAYNIVYIFVGMLLDDIQEGWEGSMKLPKKKKNEKRNLIFFLGSYELLSESLYPMLFTSYNNKFSKSFLSQYSEIYKIG